MGYEAVINRLNRGYEAVINRFNRGYETVINRLNRSQREASASFFYKKGEKKLYWCTVERIYINFMKQAEPRIPNIDYGENKLKPFFAPLFKADGLIYLTQVTSPKPRHYKMKNQRDFYKLFAPDKHLIGAVNLNYMFPVPQEAIIPITEKNIEDFVKFNTLHEKSKYINLMNLEMRCIERLHIDDKAISLYKHCLENPNDTVTKRCFNFKNLEVKCREFCETHYLKADITPKVR